MDGTTSILELDGYRVKLFPNPVSSDLIIETKHNGLEFKLFDNRGFMILQDIVENQQIVLSQLQSGIYILVLQSKSGSYLVERLIKI